MSPKPKLPSEDVIAESDGKVTDEDFSWPIAS